eukprot:c2984_g1_i2.p1 GENE.c2984_g1_i2~~c2984_g1_i2.p1  ORF type:complete len:165 (+),score=24.93 c2984_g1_i2:73-567(+)
MATTTNLFDRIPIVASSPMGQSTGSCLSFWARQLNAIIAFDLEQIKSMALARNQITLSIDSKLSKQPKARARHLPRPITKRTNAGIEQMLSPTLKIQKARAGGVSSTKTSLDNLPSLPELLKRWQTPSKPPPSHRASTKTSPPTSRVRRALTGTDADLKELVSY